ncbi:MAG: hypothetical protein IPM46_05800 [Flavobacteriales bacterium]|nr:hypothetical protein [Flavobacteriales bacterium]
MDHLILLDEPFLQIRCSPSEQFVHLTWRGHARSEEYRRGLETALDYVGKNGIRFWLADLRGMTAILQADESWANEVWFPKLFNTKLEKMAILQSRDYFNQTSVQRSFTAVNGRLTFKVAWFPEERDAMDWLFKREAMSA